MRRFSFGIILIILSALFLTGCPFAKPDQRIVLWTDRPEFAAYAQAFNSAQKEYVVEVVYKDSPASALKGKKVGRWDVAIGPFLNSVSLNDTFMPLESLFSDGTVSKPRFYQKALEKGIAGGIIDAKYRVIVVLLVLVSSLLAPILLKLLYKHDDTPPLPTKAELEEGHFD